MHFCLIINNSFNNTISYKVNKNYFLCLISCSKQSQTHDTDDADIDIDDDDLIKDRIVDI